MLQEFTWQHFLVATLVLTVLWYAFVILFFYRLEFLAFLGKRQTSLASEPLPHRWKNGVDDLDQIDAIEEVELMGTSKLPDGMSTLGSDAFGFSGGISEENKEEQIGLVPDVLQELKVVFNRLSTHDGNKRDFLEMMVSVREKFPKLAGSPNIGRINSFISDHAPFHLNAEELEDIWN